MSFPYPTLRVDGYGSVLVRYNKRTTSLPREINNGRGNNLRGCKFSRAVSGFT
jgi:hypothetical protein